MSNNKQRKEITMSKIKLSGNFVEVPIEDVAEQIEDNTYNGWKNKETWLVNIWLSNDYDLYKHYVSTLTEIVEKQSDVLYTHRLVVEELKEIVHEIYRDEHRESGLIDDLIETSLSNVDWSRLAEHYIEEIKETQGKE